MLQIICEMQKNAIKDKLVVAQLLSSQPLKLQYCIEVSILQCTQMNVYPSIFTASFTSNMQFRGLIKPVPVSPQFTTILLRSMQKPTNVRRK